MKSEHKNTIWGIGEFTEISPSLGTLLEFLVQLIDPDLLLFLCSFKTSLY